MSNNDDGSSLVWWLLMPFLLVASFYFWCKMKITGSDSYEAKWFGNKK